MFLYVTILLQLRFVKLMCMQHCIRMQQQHTHDSFWEHVATWCHSHEMGTNPLYLNSNGRKYLCFELAPNHNIQAIHRHPVTKMSSPITKKVYTIIIDGIKIVAIGEFLTIVVAKTKMWKQVSFIILLILPFIFFLCFVLISMLATICVDVTSLLVVEFSSWFPASHIMDAFDMVYPHTILVGSVVQGKLCSSSCGNERKIWIFQATICGQV